MKTNGTDEYRKNLSRKAQRIKDAEALHKARMEAATLIYDSRTQGTQRDLLDQWLADQQRQLQQAYDDALAAAFPGPAAEFAAVRKECDLERSLTLTDAEEQYELAMEHLRAAAAAAKRERKIEKWKDSPAGQKAQQEMEAWERSKQADYDAAVASGEFPAVWMRWYHLQDVQTGGCTLDDPKSIWGQGAKFREAWFKIHPEQQAMIEADTPDLYDAWMEPRRAARRASAS